MAVTRPELSPSQGFSACSRNPLYVLLYLALETEDYRTTTRSASRPGGRSGVAHPLVGSLEAFGDVLAALAAVVLRAVFTVPLCYMRCRRHALADARLLPSDVLLPAYGSLLSTSHSFFSQGHAFLSLADARLLPSNVLLPACGSLLSTSHSLFSQGHAFLSPGQGARIASAALLSICFHPISYSIPKQTRLSVTSQALA